MTHKEAQGALRSAMAVWDTVYDEALKQGPHNPQGTRQRAEELTRAYMSGWLRRDRP